MAPIPWDEVGEEALSLLQDLLRIDTTNAPDVAPNETAAAEFLAAHLENAGLAPEILESKPGKGNVICRIRGSGEAAPVLLSGHLDVVPADPKKWTHPPFAAEIHDGFVWGRGAIDMKNMVAMEVIALTLIQRLGLELKRDLIFAGVADEEAGCEWGSLWLAQHHPEKVRAEYAISEIGGFNTGEEYFAYHKDAFDMFYAEGETEPKMMAMAVHDRLMGRPARAAGLARFLDYVLKHDKVWICTGIEIARHWIEHHPYRAA